MSNRYGSQRQNGLDENDILYQWRLKRRMESAQRRVEQAEQMIRRGGRVQLTQTDKLSYAAPSTVSVQCLVIVCCVSFTQNVVA